MLNSIELEDLGVLKQTKLPLELANWMTDLDKTFLLDIYLAGKTGLSKSEVKKFEKNNAQTVLTLLIKQLCEWENDKRGKPAFLVLTWKGTEVAQLLMKIAKNQSNIALKEQNGKKV